MAEAERKKRNVVVVESAVVARVLRETAQFLIARFVKDVNTKQRPSFYFLEL